MVKEKGSRAKAVLRVRSRCRRGSRLTRSRLSGAESAAESKSVVGSLQDWAKHMSHCWKFTETVAAEYHSEAFPTETIWLNDGQGQFYIKPDF